MEVFSWDIISQVFTLKCLMYMSLGTLLGLFIGAMPGMGPPLGIALLLPFCRFISPLESVTMLMCLYMAAEYGGAISAVTIGVPGTGAAVCTLFDARPMAAKGEPGRAMGISLSSSAIGGLFSVVCLMFMTTALKDVVYALTDPELTTIALFGLISIANIGSKNVAKGLISVLLGLLMGTIGLDAISGAPRFTLGIPSLYDGVGIVAVVIGLYCFPRLLDIVTSDNPSKRTKVEKQNLNARLVKGDTKKILPVSLFGGVTGTIIGIIPGMGAGPASVMSYNICKGFKGYRDTFGTGDPRGIACTESANNACVGGALVPFLTLGIAGSSSVALLGSALMSQGIEPGATLMVNQPNLVYGLMWGLLVGTILMFVFGLFATSVFARLLVIPDSLMAPILLFFSFSGAYVSHYLGIDVWVAILVGIVVFFMKKLEYPLTNFIVAFVLADIFESSFRRSLVLSKGSLDIFLTNGICLVFLALILIVISSTVLRTIRERRAKKADIVEEA